MQYFVCLTFDLDNASPFIARGLNTSMISRGDFGTVGTQRLFELLGQNQIHATWFIPRHSIETYPACARAVFEAGR